MRELFERILVAVPEEEPEPKRLEVDAMRRGELAEMQKFIDNMQ